MSDDDTEARELLAYGTVDDFAAFFARRVRDRLRYDLRSKSWLLFDGQRWQVDNVGAPMRLVTDTVRELERLAGDVQDEALRTRALKRALRMCSYWWLSTTLRIARRELTLRLDRNVRYNLDARRQLDALVAAAERDWMAPLPAA